MSTTLFDTHEYIKRLEHAGIARHQAEAHSTSLAQAMDNQLAKTSDVNLLKEDLSLLKTDANLLKVDVNALNVDIHGLKVDVNTLKVDMNLLKSDMREFRAQVTGQFTLMKWMLSFLIASTVGVWLQLLK